MMKKTNKIMAVVITLCMIIALLPANLMLAETVTSGDITWNDGDSINETLTVKGENTTISVNGTVQVNSPIFVESGNVKFTGGGTLVLAANSTSGMINITGGSVTLENITLDGGGDGGVSGRALYISSPPENVNLVINEGTVIRNFVNAAGYGSALYASTYGANVDIKMNGGKIISNKARNYGNLYLNSDNGVDGCIFTFNGGEISNNQITLETASYGGGAFYVRTATLNVNGGSITNNSAGTHAEARGGGIYNTSYGKIVLSGGEISGNTATMGSGIFHSARQDSVSVLCIGGDAKVDDVIYLDNSTMDKYPLITSAVKNPFTLVTGSFNEDGVIAKGEGYVLTEADLAKINISAGASTYYAKLDSVSNQIVMTATDPNYTVKYNITYYGNGGTGSVTDDTGYSFNDTAVIKENAFSRTDHTFIGWNTRADGNGTPYAKGESVAMTADLVLYAQWKKVESSKDEKGIFAGRYSYRQVFGCQRSPSIPQEGAQFTVSDFERPMDAVASTANGARVQFTENAIKDKVFYFKKTDNLSAPFALYMADDVAGTGETPVSIQGNIYGLGAKGFLYISDDDGSGKNLGYFISNEEGYQYGDGFTYVPDITGPITVEQAEEYDAANVTPQEKVLTSISVKTAPAKTQYREGENFDPSGLVLTLTYDNDDTSTKDVLYTEENAKDFLFTPSLSDVLMSADTVVKIEYGGKSTSQEITVNPKTTVTITETQQKKTYDKNPQTFDIIGTTLTGFAVEYKVDNVYGATAPIHAGTYDIRITRAEDGTHKAYEKEIAGGLVIAPKELGADNIENISDVTYTGEEVKPVLAVKDGATALELDTDYSVTYENNRNAGEAKAVVTFKKNYAGTVEKTFSINPKTIHAAIALPAPVANAAVQTAIEADEYTADVEWSPVAEKYAYLTVYTATITITPKDNYTTSGILENAFTVSGANSVTNAADGNVVTAVFPKTGRKATSSGSITRYTVKFDTDGGSAVSSKSVVKNAALTEPTAPAKEGYIFDGWYTDSGLTVKYDFASKVSKSFTLYAKWNRIVVDNSQNEIILTVGDKNAMVFGELKTNDVAPVIKSNRTMLPTRFVAENLGATVAWNAIEHKVTVTKGETVIIIYIDSNIAYVNDKEVTLDSAAFIENDRTYTPLRFIAENLGASVDWDETERKVTITKQ